VEASATAPAAPYRGAARTKGADNTRRFLGAVLTDSAGAVYNQRRVGDLVTYLAQFNAAPFRVLSAGAATSYTSVSAAAAVPPTSTRALARVLTNANSGVNLSVSTVSADLDNVQPSNVATRALLELNASRAFQYANQATGGATYVDVYGYWAER
jgi:hypothetical protein